jgi:hypothetical protein
MAELPLKVAGVDGSGVSLSSFARRKRVLSRERKATLPALGSMPEFGPGQEENGPHP